MVIQISGYLFRLKVGSEIKNLPNLGGMKKIKEKNARFEVSN